MNKYRHMDFLPLLIAYREKIRKTYDHRGHRGYLWDYQVYLIRKMEEELLRRPVNPGTADQQDANCAELARAAANERDRQREEEDFSEDHDRQHTQGELVHASACYLRASLYPDGAREMPVPPSWPFEPKAWKPTSAQRNLEKALALILAEEARINQCPTTQTYLPDVNKDEVEATAAAIRREYGQVIGDQQAENIAYIALQAARSAVMNGDHE